MQLIFQIQWSQKQRFIPNHKNTVYLCANAIVSRRHRIQKTIFNRLAYKTTRRTHCKLAFRPSEMCCLLEGGVEGKVSSENRSIHYASVVLILMRSRRRRRRPRSATDRIYGLCPAHNRCGTRIMEIYFVVDYNFGNAASCRTRCVYLSGSHFSPLARIPLSNIEFGRSRRTDEKSMSVLPPPPFSMCLRDGKTGVFQRDVAFKPLYCPTHVHSIGEYTFAYSCHTPLDCVAHENAWPPQTQLIDIGCSRSFFSSGLRRRRIKRTRKYKYFIAVGNSFVCHPEIGRTTRSSNIRFFQTIDLPNPHNRIG